MQYQNKTDTTYVNVLALTRLLMYRCRCIYLYLRSVIYKYIYIYIKKSMGLRSEITFFFFFWRDKWPGNHTAFHSRDTLGVTSFSQTEGEMRAADEKFLYVMNSSAPPPLASPSPSPPLHGRRVPVISGFFFHILLSEKIHRFASGAFFSFSVLLFAQINTSSGISGGLAD